ncbi:MAG: protein kinase [Planctomycetaceae bacterium]|nr:protein kinase [Planctomycetaceae bacterium]
MKPRDDREFARLPEEVMLTIDRLCNRFEQSWRSGVPMRVETVLKELDTKHRRAGLAELLPLEIEYRQKSGQSVTIEELQRRFPTVQKEWLQSQLAGGSEPTTFSATPEPASATLPELLGDYRILSRLGGGGMGAVYRAVHERMGREVALKVLKPEIQNNESLRQRFDREVRAAARLSHPNVVTALDARSHDGVHFLVTELVEGSDLDHHVRQHGPLSVIQAMDVLLQAANGLAYAHSQGVIHRDIKPANLLLSREGVVKILDMGLARLETDAAKQQESGLTDTGVVMGTAAYMPPEQARDTRRADARSDIYSLGCTLHFLLTGRPVYTGVSQVDTILSHVNQPVPSLRQIDSRIPVSLDALFQSMIAKDPAARIQTAKEVADRLSQLREQRLDGSDSAEMRDLIAQMSIVSAAGEINPAPTEFQFAEPEKTRMISRPVRKQTSKPLLIGGTAGIVILSVITLVFWNQGDGRQENSTPQQDDNSNDVPVIDSNVPPKDLNQGTARVPGNSKANGKSADLNISGGWQFDGSSSYIGIPQLTPEQDSSYTIEVIARADRYQVSNLVTWLGPSWMAIYMNENGLLGTARQLPDSPDVRSSAEVLAQDRWSHIAATFDGAQMQLYINGRLVSQQTQNFELSDTRGGLFIGGVDSTLLPNGQNQRFFPGKILAARVTRGVRYDSAFAVPSDLPADSETIVILDATGSEPVFRDANGQIVQATAVNVSR